MRIATLTLLLAALGAGLLASPALAWREPPPLTLAGDGGIACLREQAPGQLTLLRGGSDGRRTASELVTVADGRLSSAPLPLPAGATTADEQGCAAATAVAPDGAAVATWLSPWRDGRPSFVWAALRAPGAAAFGPPRRLGRADADDLVRPRAGISDAGVAHVLWSGAGRGDGARVQLSSAPAGGPFGAPRDVAKANGEQPALAVSATGRVLVALPGWNELLFWEAAPRPDGTGLEPPRAPLRLAFPSSSAAAALTPGGGVAIAVLADSGASVALLRRPEGARAFAPPRELATTFPTLSPQPGLVGPGRYVEDASGQPQLGLRLSASGELLVAWRTPILQARAGAAYVAAGTLAGGVGAVARLGGPARSITAVTPLALTDGRLAVAWSDHGGGSAIAEEELSRGAAAVHVALPEPAPSPVAAPDVQARVVTARPLGSGEALAVRVRCEVSCTARARAIGRRAGRAGLPVPNRPVGAARGAELRAGRTAVLRIPMFDRWAFAQPGRRTPVRVVVDAVTEDGARQRVIARAWLRGKPLPRMPRIFDLRAVRRGADVRVSWRMSGPLPRGTHVTVATRSRDGEWARLANSIERAAGRRFAATVRGRRVDPQPLVSVSLSTRRYDNVGEARVAIR